MPYTFHTGASWLGKGFSRASSFCPSDTFSSWKDDMFNTGTGKFGKKDPGHDFFFIQQIRNQSGVSMGVADGIGAWRDRVGIDPSPFSQTLMYYAHQFSRGAWAGEPEINPTMDYKCEASEPFKGQKMTPYECLDLAYSSVLLDNHVEGGSSTACILSLDSSSGLLRSANLGDSGYSIIRSNEVFYSSSRQSHCFNVPRQLVKFKPNMNKEDYFYDYPNIADTHEVQLTDGDIVVLYTDGLSDNAFPSEIIDTICSSAAQAGDTEDEQAKNMADQLVDFATRCMRDEKKKTPFQCEARLQDFSFYGGGKPDDVTVIVCLVRET